ncbi:phosphoprotein [Kolongo virus]|uniref:Phosphoprotein n=1 Tax=Kolongo virus TaxID=380436 RepID=A0AAE8XC70_9RHAB|nr:phosphoprotein [Kolongo virus]UAU42880.1 phosphoprotein [Kolongo virus]
MNPDQYRIQRTKAIFNCIKNEENNDEEGRGSNTDFGGMHRLELPSTSRGSSPPEPFQVGKTDVSPNSGKDLSDLVWGDESTDEKIFQNPYWDKNHERRIDFEDPKPISGRSLKIDENWQMGYSRGLQDAIGKISKLGVLPEGIELELMGFEIIAKKNPSLRSQQLCFLEEEEKAQQLRHETQVLELLREINDKKMDNQKGIQGRSSSPCLSQSTERVFKAKQVSEEMILTSDEFLNLIDDGLHYTYQGFEKYICLSEVRASKFRILENEVMSLHEWIVKTCFD